MLRMSSYGEVQRFDLGRNFAGRGRYWTTCYWVDGLLIDSGSAHTAAELRRALDGRQVHTLVNTHSHEDHIGGNAPIQRSHPELSILAHPLALQVLADPRRRQPLHPYRRLFWGWPQPTTALPVQDGELLELGPWRFRVIFTPGHSPDHLCLFEERRGWLFSGDLFVGGRDRALRQGCDIWGIIASLERVWDMPITLLFPGSAKVRQNPCDDLLTKIAYYRELGERILALHQKGWSVDAITREVCGGPMWIEAVTLGHFARKWLVLSYLNPPKL